jgi:hypothetical protein
MSERSFSRTRVLLILASPGDVEAYALAAGWERDQAAVVTWADLSCPGWRYSSQSAHAAACSVGGKVVPVADIDAILTRAATVDPLDLADIAAPDRDYVAGEMHAFLVAWLTALGGRVVNRPTPRSLLGPYWPPEDWIHLAATLGIPVHPTHRRVGPLTASARATPSDDGAGDDRGERGIDLAGELLVPGNWLALTVVGERVSGDGDGCLKEHAVALARAAGVDLLSVLFDGDDASARLVGADPRPVLGGDEEVVDAVRRYLCTRR